MADGATPFPEVNVILESLLPRAREILGAHFVGMYLHGSLAYGDFDAESDVDFVVVTDEELTEEQFDAIRAMHDDIAAIDSPFAIQLEGTYISKRALWRFDPRQSLHPNIDRGRGERLKMMQYDDGWIVECHVLRERGLTLAGPQPRSLIAPVTPHALRQAMHRILDQWAARIFGDPSRMRTRGYQSFTVLSLCRILYTLDTGRVVSKPVAAQWAKDALGGPWAALIDRAWIGRQHPDALSPQEDIEWTLDFIAFARERRSALARPAASRDTEDRLNR
jgi:predicted nucleotidyltransferase